jgi:molybdopterin-guanine dinucleotide biosynthesis protein A
MGGADKALLEFGSEKLIERAIKRAQPQTSELLINTNSDSNDYRTLGPEILPDRVGGFLGPLAGIFSGLDWVRENRPNARWLATFACDCPFFPLDFVERLIAGAESKGASIAYAASGERHHPVFAVWSTAIADTSESALTKDGFRKVDDFIARHPSTSVMFEFAPHDPFFNVNAPEDLARAEALMANIPGIR